jgi:hypothetical protein
VNHPRKRLKDGHFLRARRSEVFGEVGAAAFVEVLAFGGQDSGAVLLGGVGGVDSGDLEVVEFPVQGFCQVCSRVGGGQVHLVAAFSEGDSDGGGDGGLADSAFAHAHDQAVIVGVEFVDQG